MGGGWILSIGEWRGVVEQGPDEAIPSAELEASLGAVPGKLRIEVRAQWQWQTNGHLDISAWQDN
jgi:hypothetical protein